MQNLFQFDQLCFFGNSNKNSSKMEKCFFLVKLRHFLFKNLFTSVLSMVHLYKCMDYEYRTCVRFHYWYVRPHPERVRGRTPGGLKAREETSKLSHY